MDNQIINGTNAMRENAKLTIDVIAILNGNTLKSIFVLSNKPLLLTIDGRAWVVEFLNAPNNTLPAKR